MAAVTRKAGHAGGGKLKFLPNEKLEREDHLEFEWVKRAGTWRVEEPPVAGQAPMIIVDVPAKFGLERFRETAQLLEDGRLFFDSFEMTDNPFTDSCL